MERSRTDPINAEAKEYLSGKTYSMETVSEIHNTIQTPVNSLADDITTDYKSAKTEPTSNQVDIVIKKMKEESKVDEPQVTKLTEGIQAEKSDILYNAPIYKVETEPNTLERDKRENIFEMSKQPTHEIPANKYLDQEKFELQKVEPENSCQRNNGKTVENINANNVVDTKATVIQRENHGKQAEDEVTSKISDGDSVRSDEGILAINTDIQKQNKTKYTENKDESNTIQTQVKNDKKPDSNFESQQQIAETKTHELERRESRISEKSATAVQAYQEALERILKAAKDKKKDKGDNEDDSSDIGLDLWKRAKASVLKNMKTPKQADTIQEGQEEGRVHAVRFHRWKRTAVPPARQSGYSNRRRSITEMQNTLRKKLALRRFRRIGNLVIFCRRCVQDHCFKFRERSELTPYMQTLNYMDYTADQIKDLMFDRTKFRADRQMRISEETKKILSKRKSHRTEHEIYSAQIALRNNRSFSEYPARMQQMMAECGHYEAYEAKRVITREGHPPAAFYFVLSGAVVAMQLDQGRNIASAVAEFVKGDTFEEKPMLTDTPRECTILTKEPCEFLSISEKDYKNIFMQGGVKTLNDPDQELFLKSLSCLQGWPIRILQNHPTKSRFHYYKRGAILVMDTRRSDWLIIVKSGSLSVLKKLKRVGPYEWKKNAIKPLTEKEKRDRQERKTHWRRFILPELRLPLRKHNEVDEIEELVDGRPKPFQHPDIKVQFEDDGREKKGKKYRYPSLWTIKRGVEDDDKDQQQFSNINKQYLYLMSSSGDKEQDKSNRHRPKPSTHTKESTKLSAVEERSVKSPSLSEHTARSSSSATPGAEWHTKLKLGPHMDKPHSVSSLSSLIGSSDFDERIRNIMEDVYSDGRKTPENFSEMDNKPQFVKVQTLVKGGVWGLADIILEEQTSFTIVSNGADCVLINKQFYLEHASEKLLRKLRHDLCPYPSDDELQQGLQVSVDWNDYRRNELSSTMNVVKGKRLMRDIVLGGPAAQDTC